MKKIIILSAMLLNILSASAINTNTDGTYLIASAEDLCEFAN